MRQDLRLPLNVNYIEVLLQERRNYIANTVELRLSCTHQCCVYKCQDTVYKFYIVILV